MGELWQGLLAKKLPWREADLCVVLAKHSASWGPGLRGGHPAQRDVTRLAGDLERVGGGWRSLWA